MFGTHFVDKSVKLIATNLQHVTNQMIQRQHDILPTGSTLQNLLNLLKVHSGNYNVALFTENGYLILFKIAPPDRNVDMLILNTMQQQVIDVVDCYNTIQTHGDCWSML